MVFTRDGRMYTGVVLNTEPSAHVADEKVEMCIRDRIMKECHSFACVSIESNRLSYDAPFIQFSYSIIDRVYSKGCLLYTSPFL